MIFSEGGKVTYNSETISNTGILSVEANKPITKTGFNNYLDVNTIEFYIIVSESDTTFTHNINLSGVDGATISVNTTNVKTIDGVAPTSTIQTIGSTGGNVPFTLTKQIVNK